MVIGNGMIANRFASYKNTDDIIIFASGVSNSKETVEENFLREFTLLKKTIKEHPENILVYFSTCSVEDTDLALAPYVIHKKRLKHLLSKMQQNITCSGFQTSQVLLITLIHFLIILFLIFLKIIR